MNSDKSHPLGCSRRVTVRSDHSAMLAARMIWLLDNQTSVGEGTGKYETKNISSNGLYKFGTTRIPIDCANKLRSIMSAKLGRWYLIRRSKWSSVCYLPNQTRNARCDPKIQRRSVSKKKRKTKTSLLSRSFPCKCAAYSYSSMDVDGGGLVHNTSTYIIETALIMELLNFLGIMLHLVASLVWFTFSCKLLLCGACPCRSDCAVSRPIWSLSSSERKRCRVTIRRRRNQGTLCTPGECLTVWNDQQLMKLRHDVLNAVWSMRNKTCSVKRGERDGLHLGIGKKINRLTGTTTEENFVTQERERAV